MTHDNGHNSGTEGAESRTNCGVQRRALARQATGPTAQVPPRLPESVRQELTNLLAEILVLDFQTYTSPTDKPLRGISRTPPNHRTAQVITDK